ncbi:MAG: RNA-directed DNA polymerase [Solirubrobacteraceae bacterium]|nr:RNA-directed DNA polymerase [Solirubrobacteraceae bacterium]
MTSDLQTVAGALASAFLRGVWNERRLVARGERMIGQRPVWLTPLVRRVLEGYHRPPADRPRELQAFIRVSLRDITGRARLAKRVEMRHWSPTPTVMVDRRWRVPILHTVGDLGALLGLDPGALMWLADARGLERFAPEERLRNYRYTWVPRTTGAPRLLEAPKARLKVAQRDVLRRILCWVPPHDAAYGFIRGRSARDHAARHTGREVVLSFDLMDFFAGVPARRVYGIYRLAGYPEPVAHCLTALCTNQIPRTVSNDILGRPDPAYALLRRRLGTPHLPQGAPTSPALANLVAHALDRRLTGLAAALGGTYTRYADDLVISGDAQLARRIGVAQRAVAEIAADEGFVIRPAKTRRMSRADRQAVCGIVVNARTNIPRRDYDRLKAILHDAVRHGPDAANRDGIADFRAHLAGRVAWVTSLNPDRGAKLRTTFDAIVWDPRPQT